MVPLYRLETVMDPLRAGIGRAGYVEIQDFRLPAFQGVSEHLHFRYMAVGAPAHGFPDLAVRPPPVLPRIHLPDLLDDHPCRFQLGEGGEAFIQLLSLMRFQLMGGLADDLRHPELFPVYRLQRPAHILHKLQSPLDDMEMVNDDTGFGKAFLRHAEVERIHVDAHFPHLRPESDGDLFQFFLR